MSHSLSFFFTFSAEAYHDTNSTGSALLQLACLKSGRRSCYETGLGEGYPSAFGELLDYARYLGFDEPIDYERFRTVFENLRHPELKIKRNVYSGKIFMSVGGEDALIDSSTDPMPKSLRSLLEISLSFKLTH